MIGQLVNLWRKLCRWPQVRILVDLISRDLRNQQKKGFKKVSEHNRFYKNALNKNVRKTVLLGDPGNIEYKLLMELLNEANEVF